MFLTEINFDQSLNQFGAKLNILYKICDEVKILWVSDGIVSKWLLELTRFTLLTLQYYFFLFSYSIVN